MTVVQEHVEFSMLAYVDIIHFGDFTLLIGLLKLTAFIPECCFVLRDLE